MIIANRNQVGKSFTWSYSDCHPDITFREGGAGQLEVGIPITKTTRVPQQVYRGNRYKTTFRVESGGTYVCFVLVDPEFSLQGLKDPWRKVRKLTREQVEAYITAARRGTLTTHHDGQYHQNAGCL